MKTICITGLDGSGKSTQVKRLAKKLKNCRTSSVWDLITRPEFQEWSVYKTPPDIEKYVMNLSSTARTLFVFHTFQEAYERAIQSDVEYVIFDGFWYKYLAIELAMGCDKGLGDFLKTQYKTPDFVFYLDLPNSSLQKRKPTISHYESGNKDQIDYTNFLKIQKSAKQLIEEFLPEKTVWIDAELSIEEIVSIINKTITKNN